MSNNKNNQYKALRLSFYGLFNELDLKISIPIIQRDYAQGRASSLEVRDNFLEALYNYLEAGVPFRDLDFIYGSIEPDKEKLFVPLDGQQRLTTLFLLHWYLALISDNLPTFRSFIQNNGKSRFTYETRASSTEFCDALISSELKKPSQNEKVSEIINDASWYFLSWKYDPTIQSMLVMLDAIHKRFFYKPDFFSQLVNKEKPIITFLFLDLLDFNLTDDLYIKMNARGKPLTSYENFKAKLEQHCNHITARDREFTLLFSEQEKVVTLQEYFSYSIDTRWANLFWNYRHLVSNKQDEVDNNFDDEIMNFIRVFLTNEYATSKTYQYEDEKGELDPIEYLLSSQTARRKPDYTDNYTFNKYLNIELLKEENIIKLVDTFDALVNGDSAIKCHLPENFYFDEDKCFRQVLLHQLTLTQRLQFHAYCRYLIYNKKKTEGLFDWMRIIHNLVANTTIDGADDFMDAVKSINALIPISQNILEQVKSENQKIDFFYGGQSREERIKAHLVTRSDAWYKQVCKIESHEYLTGQIAFILEFSGILEYYKQHGNCNWSNEEDQHFMEIFTNYAQKAGFIFNNLYTPFNENFIWERSVLVKGDYFLPATRERYNLLSTNKFLRDYSWKRLLRMSAAELGEEKIIDADNDWLARRNLVKEVIDCIEPLNFEDSLKKIIKQGATDWRKYFIEEPELIRYCLQGFIRFNSGDDIILYRHTKSSQYHHEMYTYHMFLKIKSKLDRFVPFKVSPYEVRSREEYSCLFLTDFCYRRVNYNIEVYYDDITAELPYCYKIKFCKAKGSQAYHDYSSEIITLLDGLNFVWNEEYNGFWLTKKSEDTTIEALYKVCEALRELQSVLV